MCSFKDPDEKITSTFELKDLFDDLLIAFVDLEDTYISQNDMTCLALVTR